MSLDWSEILWALKNTLYQATISTALSIFFGFILSLGLLQATQKTRDLLQYLLLAPNLLPSILSILCFYWYLPGIFQGIISIALVHTLINAGFVAVTLFPFLYARSIEMSSAYFIYGIKKNIWYKILFLSIKNNILLVSLMVFIFCWGSLSVPLIVGGQHGTTIEVLIFEMIRTESTLKPAFTVGILQFVLMFIFSFFFTEFILEKKSLHSSSQVTQLKTGSKSGLFMIFLYIFIWFCPFLIGGIKGILSESFSEISFKQELIESIKLSGIISFLILATIITFLVSYKLKFLSRLVSQLPSISPNIVALALLISFSFQHVYLLYIIGIIFLLLPSILKSGGLEMVNQSEPIKKILQLYSINSLYDRFQVLILGNKKKISTLIWISFSWIFGDFVFARLIFGQDKTFAMLIDSLLSHYRLEQAMALALIMIMVLFLIGLFIWSINFVFDKRSLFKN